MKNYKTNEEVEKDFDKEFEPSNFYSQIRPDLIIIKLKSFISTLLLKNTAKTREELLSKMPDYKLNKGYMEYGDKKTFAEGYNTCKNEIRDIINKLNK